MALLGKTLPRVDQPLLEALAARNFAPRVVPDARSARELVLSLLPDGALVSHGGSTTIEQSGLPEALASSRRVRYGNAEWLAEDDDERRLEIRKHTRSSPTSTSAASRPSPAPARSSVATPAAAGRGRTSGARPA